MPSTAPTALPTDEITVEQLASHYGKSLRTMRRAIAAAGVHPIGRGPDARLTKLDVRRVVVELRAPRHNMKAINRKMARRLKRR